MKANFQITWLKEHRPNRQRPAQTFDVEELRVGSGAKADVRINDRLVAGLALKLRPALGGLSVEPIDLFAGAFLNGVPVTGHEVLEPGGALQLGQALIELAVPEPAKFVLSIDEGYLDHAVRKLSLDPATKEFASLEHDGPPEASWGKDVVQRRLTVGATVIAAIVLCSSSWIGGASPGALSSAHASARTQSGRALDCYDCHVGSFSAPEMRCVECHEAQAPGKGAHPPANAAAEMTARCTQCHFEHRGRDVRPWTPVKVDLAAVAHEPLLPAAAAKEVCARCHGEALPAKRVAELAPTRDRARPIADLALQFESFSHAEHLHPSALFERGKTITCATCHLRLDEGARERAGDTARAGDVTRDFATVTYESCLPCHAWRLKGRKHGRDSGVCTDCHAKEGGKELKTVTPAPSASRYEFQPQDHPVTKQACVACHKTGRIGVERAVKGELFRHDHHLTVFPAGALDEETARKECAGCHANVRDSKSLADLARGGRLDVDLGACGKCHKGEAKVVGSEPAAAASASPRADIVHRAHAAGDNGNSPSDVLTRGCFSCHGLAADGVHMSVRDGARDCAACHKDHVRISCASCHQDLDHPVEHGTPPRCERSVIDAKAAVVAKRGGVERFDHFTPNHEPLACETCHAGVDRSVRLKEIALPTPTQEACTRCHAIARFHR